MNLKPEKPGERLYFDTIPLEGKSLGGYVHGLISSDGHSGFVTVNGMRNKLVTTVKDTIQIVIAFYRSYGWEVKQLVFDRDPSFMPLEHVFPGVTVTFYPAGMKNKVAERAIQDVALKRRCLLNALPYHIPSELELKSYEVAARCMSLLPNSKTGQSQCPHYLVTGLRSVIPKLAFGQPVLAYARSSKDHDQRAEYGMYIDQAYTGDHIIYNPIFKNLVSRRVIELIALYPAGWKVIRKPKMVATKAASTIEDLLPNLQPTVRTAEDVTQSINTQANPLTETPAPAQPILPVTTSSNPVNNVIPVTHHELFTRLRQRAFVSTTSNPDANPIKATPTRTSATRHDDAYVTATAAMKKLSDDSYSSASIINLIDEEPKPKLPTVAYNTSFIRAKGSQGVPVKAIVPKIDKYQLNARIIAYRISLKAALNDPNKAKANSAHSAMRDELKQLMASGTFEAAHYHELNDFEKSKVIPSHMFLKEKFKGDGSFDKIKARLVAGSNFVDTSQLGDIAAHVVNPITVMMLLNIAALQSHNIMTIDVKGAFLIPQLSDNPEELVFVKIDITCSGELADMFPYLEKYIDSRGMLTMRCKKSLYGLPSASYHWANHLATTLTKLKFTRLDGDKCAWTRGTDDNVIRLGTHVDDLLCIGKPAALKVFGDEFSDEYECNMQTGIRHSYLGLDIVQERATYTVSVGQSGYRKELLNMFEYLIAMSKGGGRTPCNDDITTHIPSEDADRTEFMSVVMSVMFLARFTRPDLLFTVGVLSTQCNKPTRVNMRQAIKLLKYIKDGPDLVIVYKTAQLLPVIYADASHAIHKDGKGHGCIILRMGTGVIYARSFKIKMVTLSSTESEWVVLCEATTLAEWFRGMLLQFGYGNPRHITILQDNTSTILIATNGGNFARTKHLLVKRNKAREGVSTGMTVIKYCPTATMRADVGTKPLSYRSIVSHLNGLGFMTLDRTDGRYRLRALVIPKDRQLPVRRPAAKLSKTSSTPK